MNEAAPNHPPKRPWIDTSAFLGHKGVEQFATTSSKTRLGWHSSVADIVSHKRSIQLVWWWHIPRSLDDGKRFGGHQRQGSHTGV